MRKITVALLLLSACRLSEEPVQQAKGFVSGDVVFDAQDLSKTAVVQCRDDDCRSKTPLAATLHQASLRDQPAEVVLQFNDLHISFVQADKTYTCLRLQAPLGKMTLLRRAGEDTHCYEQATDKNYVQQFAVTCLAERDWQLVAGSDAQDLRQFACKNDGGSISSACFTGESGAANCEGSSWPDAIRAIHAQVGTKAVAARDRGGVDGETLLADVSIKVEWKLTAAATCKIGDKVFITAAASTSKKTKTVEVPADTGHQTVGAAIYAITCSYYDTNTSTSLALTHFLPAACVNKSNIFPQTIEDCGAGDADPNHIKITFVKAN